MIQNKRKDKKIAEGAAAADADLVHGFEDVTDMVSTYAYLPSSTLLRLRNLTI